MPLRRELAAQDLTLGAFCERRLAGATRNKMRGSLDMNRTRRRLECDGSNQRAQRADQLTTFCGASAHGLMQLRGAALPRFRGSEYNQRPRSIICVFSWDERRSPPSRVVISWRWPDAVSFRSCPSVLTAVCVRYTFGACAKTKSRSRYKWHTMSCASVNRS